MDAKDEARESNALFRARQVKEVNRLNDRIAELENELVKAADKNVELIRKNVELEARLGEVGRITIDYIKHLRHTEAKLARVGEIWFEPGRKIDGELVAAMDTILSDTPKEAK